MSGPNTRKISNNKYYEVIAWLENRYIFRADELSFDRIDKRQIQALLDDDIINRFSRGVYYKYEVEDHEHFEIALASTITGGVVCSQTAAYCHGLISNRESGLDIISSRNKASRFNWGHLDVRLRRTADMDLRKDTEVWSDGKLRFDITTPARTVVDLLRYGLAPEVCSEAFGNYRSLAHDASDLDAVAERLACIDGLNTYAGQGMAGLHGG